MDDAALDLVDVECPMVLLRHELSDGSSHLDWMLARERSPRSRLLTFRLENAVHELEPGESLSMERIADHRNRYLRYEGPLSGGRGEVSRQARGMFCARHVEPGSAELELHWQPVRGRGVRQIVDLRVDSPPFWTIRCNGFISSPKETMMNK